MGGYVVGLINGVWFGIDEKSCIGGGVSDCLGAASKPLLAFGQEGIFVVFGRTVTFGVGPAVVDAVGRKGTLVFFGHIGVFLVDSAGLSVFAQ